MEKRIGVITMKGNPLTLLGTEIKVGDLAPDFSVLDSSLNAVGLKDDTGKTILISVVPSVDTSVCDQQTRRFNEEAAKLEDVVIYTISVDLPFALDRYCAAAGIDQVKTLSDHRDLSFGLGYGFAIEELRLLARGIVVIDPEGIVRHVEYVNEVTSHPDYEKALEVARSL